MDFIHNAIRWLTRWTNAHLHQIAVALVTSVIALYAADIKRFIRKHIKNWSFLSRTTVFVLVSGVGFGLVVVLASPHLARLLARFGGGYSRWWSRSACLQAWAFWRNARVRSDPRL